MVSIWDHTAKKQLWQYPKYMLGMQDITFNVNGSWVVVEVSYGWEHSEDALFILFSGGCRIWMW